MSEYRIVFKDDDKRDNRKFEITGLVYTNSKGIKEVLTKYNNTELFNALREAEFSYMIKSKKSYSFSQLEEYFIEQKG